MIDILKLAKEAGLLMEPKAFELWVARLPGNDYQERLQRFADLIRTEPIDMVLHCPACGMQHIDAPEPPDILNRPLANLDRWHNPPHRSHLCHACGHIWRPADVPTNGVAAVKTSSKNDSPVVSPRLDAAVRAEQKEKDAAICDRFQKRGMEPAECAAAIRSQK